MLDRALLGQAGPWGEEPVGLACLLSGSALPDPAGVGFSSQRNELSRSPNGAAEQILDPNRIEGQPSRALIQMGDCRVSTQSGDPPSSDRLPHQPSPCIRCAVRSEAVTASVSGIRRPSEEG